MYYGLRTSIKETGLRGWSYNMDETPNGKRKTYLSKFDGRERKNNDEYKIYFEIEKKELKVVDAIVFKGLKAIISLSPSNQHLIEATKILEEFAQKNGMRFNDNF